MRRRPENFNLFINGFFTLKGKKFYYGKFCLFIITFFFFVQTFAWKVCIKQIIIKAKKKIDILVHQRFSNLVIIFVLHYGKIVHEDAKSRRKFTEFSTTKFQTIFFFNLKQIFPSSDVTLVIYNSKVIL